MARNLHITDITDKNVRQVVAEFPGFQILRGRKHLKIVNPATGRFVTAPCTGSDWRGPRNLRRDLHKLAANSGETWNHLPAAA